MKFNDEKFEISVPIVPAVNCSEKDISIIRSGLLKAVSYLEKLTNYRYYPVSTYIVDDYILNQVGVRNEEDDNYEKDGYLKEVLKEMFEFLNAVCLSFHTRAVKLEKNQERYFEENYNDPYAKFSLLSSETRNALRIFGEMAGCIFDETLKGNISDIRPIHIAEISKEQNPLLNLFENLSEILKILKNILKVYGDDVSLSDSYFKRWSGNEITVDPQKWKILLSNDEYKQIENCVECYDIFDGYVYKKQLKFIIVVFEIIMKHLVDAIEKYLFKNTKYYPISSSMHTYGVYIHKSSENDYQFDKILRDNGLPHWFIQNNSGKVLICLERCYRRLEEISHKNNLSEEQKDELFEKLITATLIHEHAHAITFEGVNSNCEYPYFEDSQNTSDSKIVSESIAEWTELNYFREDKELFEIILNHAKSDKLKNWPYEGALLIENAYKKTGNLKFKTVLEHFRRDAEEGYKVLRQ